MNANPSSELVLLEEGVSGSSMTRDDLHLRPRGEVEMAARKWFGVATDLKTVQDQLVEDLETALNMARSYQGSMARLQLNDPNLVTARRLLTKYKMDYSHASPPTRVFVDGHDITDYPDSIDGEVLPVLELTSEEYYGTSTVELVEVDGEMHFLPKGETYETPETSWDEPAPVEERSWFRRLLTWLNNSGNPSQEHGWSHE